MQQSLVLLFFMLKDVVLIAMFYCFFLILLLSRTRGRHSMAHISRHSPMKSVKCLHLASSQVHCPLNHQKSNLRNAITEPLLPTLHSSTNSIRVDHCSRFTQHHPFHWPTWFPIWDLEREASPAISTRIARLSKSVNLHGGPFRWQSKHSSPISHRPNLYSLS